MAKPVRLAVIGRGRWGKNIIKTLEAMPGCVVAYAVARNYTELLKKNDIDGVVVATPSSTHAKVALPFIQKGLSTFIEKP
ncbi:MAG: Gfo/Idh/MocA family oxidoreductase, partial [Patescibacteria group bacterium]|nr:Gfo/Idh/MocA family oxidoreductase [Patescibacteria group bacterium]